MAIWYRVSTDENTAITFSGEGGLFTAGRWNYLGRKVVYCSESIALCTLEWLAHNGLSVSGFNYYRYSIEIADKLIAKFSPTELPATWQSTPATEVTRDFAEDKLFCTDKYLAMAIPSVLIPEELNLVINPLHTAFTQALQTVKNLGQYIAPQR